MKNKYRKLAVIMLTAVCFAGCQQEDIVYPEPDAKVAETYLTLNELTQSPLQVPGPEGTYILKVISDDKWTLSSSQAWCSVSETEGFKYSQVPVSYSENPWNEPRTAELTFLINESQEIKIVTVEQEASETSLAADSKELQYNIGGGEKDITLQTNAVEWNVEVVDEPTHTPVKWCTVTPVTGKGTAT
ncbi:BACON domain-containing protein [Bacteroides thetaiotaomicron]